MPAARPASLHLDGFRLVSANEPRLSTRSPRVRRSARVAVDLKTFALYEYNGHVTIGSARPPYTTTTEFAGYNRIAINDLLGHWTPPLPAVLP